MNLLSTPTITDILFFPLSNKNVKDTVNKAMPKQN